MENKNELLKLQAMKRVRNYHSILDQEQDDKDDILSFKINNRIQTKMVDEEIDFDNAPIARLFDKVA